MEVLSLVDLAPVLGVVLAALLAMMRYQHVDSDKTRTLIHDLIRENRDQIEKSSKENRDQIRENRELIEKSSKENRDLIRENRELIEKNHAELTGSLGEIRERLSYIEGFLRQSPPPPADGAQAA